ncbi:MAG: phospho-N-acetylmuramoyl-pentapeptide-transferase [Lachnospiraceae bacterium]|nr:phospho-N-acetylmuramoyl-pentapeptide-transferase [Lachnospiraceae bacterium]
MFDLLLPLLLGFGITAVLGPVIIPFLRKLKVGNTEREELESHQVKTGTPTMGGVMMLIAITVVSLIYAPKYPNVVPVLILTLGFGLIGFLDDYLKVVKKNKDGLIAWQKLLLQIALTAFFAYYVVHFTSVSLEMIIPFTGGKTIDLGILTFPMMFFAVIGTVNGTNFTDGIDGLASTVTAVVAGFFTFASLALGAGVEPITAAVLGALLGFLLYNVYPAKVFMGDTGSLALGGFVAGVAYMMEMPLFILIVGLIYLIEVVSVILQVGYFKLTHGKRIFRMAPIHHHFELGGWSETRVVAVFSIITLLLCAIAYYAM